MIRPSRWRDSHDAHFLIGPVTKQFMREKPLEDHFSRCRLVDDRSETGTQCTKIAVTDGICRWTSNKASRRRER
jgi:hypothetical protein